MEKLVLFLFISTLIGCLADKTPVLLWSPNRPLSDLPQIYSGQTVNTDSFHSQYLTPLSTTPDNNLVVFVQDKLSVEDFTTHADVYNPNSEGGVFKNIKSAMDDQFSVHLPAVSDPTKAIDTLTNTFNGQVIRVDTPEQLASLKLDDGKKFLIIVTLAPCLGKDEAKTFKHNDETMGKCLHHLNKRGVKYSAIYTAHSSSKVDTEAGHQTGRHLLAANVDDSKQVDNGTLFVADQLMVYIRTINISLINATNAKNTQVGFQQNFTTFAMTATIDVNMTYIDFELIATEDGSTATIKMLLHGETIHGEWAAINGTFDFEGTNQNTSEKFSIVGMPMDYGIVATKRFCYHCSNLRPRQGKYNTSGETPYRVRMSLNAFQMETSFSLNDTFTMANSTFSNDVWDCVEFFTTPIWMGIITTIILVVILFFGISMLSNITTMDRFDDPKGKSITITVNE